MVPAPRNNFRVLSGRCWAVRGAQGGVKRERRAMGHAGLAGAALGGAERARRGDLVGGWHGKEQCELGWIGVR